MNDSEARSKHEGFELPEKYIFQEKSRRRFFHFSSWNLDAYGNDYSFDGDTLLYISAGCGGVPSTMSTNRLTKRINAFVEMMQKKDHYCNADGRVMSFEDEFGSTVASGKTDACHSGPALYAHH